MKVWIYYLAIIIYFAPVSIFGQEILSLNDCIERALKYNSQYKNTQSQKEIAKTNVLSAYSTILPQMNFSISGSHQYSSTKTSEYNTAIYKYNNGQPVLDNNGKPVVEKYVKTLNVTEPQSSNNYGTGVSFNQLLYDGGRWRNRIKMQNAYLDARDYDVEASKVSTIATVKRYYYELLKAQNQRIALEEAIKLAEEQLRSSKSRYEIGSVAEIDVLKSEVNLNERKIDLLSQKKIIETASNNLSAEMGQDAGGIIVVLEDSTIAPLKLSFEDIRKLAEKSNPNIKSAEEEIGGAEISYNISKGALLPTVRANFNYARANPDMGLIYHKLDQNYYWYYNLSFSIPIFDGLKTKSDIQSSSISLNMAKENHVDKKRKVLKEVKNNYIELVNNVEKVAMLKENLIVARKNAELTQERYKIGTGTILETIDAQLSFTKSRIGLIQAVYDVKIAKAQLEGAIGVDVIE